MRLEYEVFFKSIFDFDFLRVYQITSIAKIHLCIYNENIAS